MRAVALLFAFGCSGSDLPSELPYSIERADRGEPVTDEEVATFTDRLIAFWDRQDYFAWVLTVSHGVDASTGMPDYALWWHDVDAVKSGDLVTFRHGDRGGGHNVFIPTSRLLQQAAAGYALTGDPAMGAVVEQYSKAISASIKGMVWDEADPNPHLMARNIAGHNHDFVIDGGRRKAVDYSGWYNAYEAWNAQRILFPHNPYWGEIWVTNMRSKDDVPHIFSAVPYLRYVVDRADDADVRAAAEEAIEQLSGFAKDIVDSGYKIRTKDAEGQPWIPTEDLASFVQYEFIVPNAECNAKLSSALIGYGDAQGNDCGPADDNEYEQIAVGAHYYNYDIVRGFHVSAVLNALALGHDSERSLRGLVRRIDRYLDPESDEPGRDEDRWEPDLAVYLVQASAAGVPLTSEEVRMIHREYSRALDAYEAWSNWNLWDPSIADGTYGPDDGYLPSRAGIAIEDMAFLLAHCFSPFKNATGKMLFDCERLAN